MSESEWQIIIAERGWVYVGRPVREGDRIRISDCYNIRRWGTTEGLGELARLGPRSESVLDYYGTVRVGVFAIAGGEIECDDAVWSAWHAKQSQPAKGRRK